LDKDKIIQCKKCGKCCHTFIIEIGQLDVVREPRLLEHAKLLDGNGKIEHESDYEKEYLLAAGETMPCPFLVDNKCSIYPTRPNCCVAFEAGGQQCAEARLKPDTEPVAAKNKRNYIGFDIRQSQVALANKRIEAEQQKYGLLEGCKK